MLKKNKILLILTLILFMFPFTVFADTNCTISLGKGQSNTLNVGDILNLNVGIDEVSNGSNISVLEYNISFDKNVFEIVKENNHYIKTIDAFSIESDNLDNTGNNALLSFKIVANDADSYINSTSTHMNDVVSFKLKVKNSSVSQTNIIIDNGSKYTENSEVKNCSRSTVIVYIKSSNNSLSSIKVDGKELSNFNENNTMYDLNVNGNTESINISAEKKDSKSSISGDLGNKSLKYGINSFKIVVTSESGDKKTYELNVTRVDERSHVNTLKSLKISTGTLNFNPSINDYDVTVKNDVEKITITSELADAKSKYKEDYRNKTIELNEGMNKVTITVIAEDGEENTYNINITRELSSNNTLKKLTINNQEIKLKENTFLYDIEVEYDVTDAKIVATPNNEKATTEIEGDKLEVGENEINVYVTAPNGDVVSYTLIVTRKNKLSSNSLVKSIIISGYSLNFKTETMYYNLKIKDDDVLDIKVVPEDDRSKVEIEGNKDLVDGSIIKITVRSEDNTVTRYFITIEKGNKGSLSWLIILLILLIIIAIIILFIIRKKEKQLNKDTILEPIEEKYQEELAIKDDQDEEEEPEDEKQDEDQNEEKETKTKKDYHVKRNVLVNNNEEE